MINSEKGRICDRLKPHAVRNVPQQRESKEKHPINRNAHFYFVRKIFLDSMSIVSDVVLVSVGHLATIQPLFGHFFVATFWPLFSHLFVATFWPLFSHFVATLATFIFFLATFYPLGNNIFSSYVINVCLWTSG